MGTMFHELLPNSVVITRTSFPTTDWSTFDTVIFAIRPQDYKLLSPLPLKEKLIISVMAGIRTANLVSLTGSKTVIRCMPNTTVRMKAGMTVWCKTEDTSPDQSDWFVQTLSSETKLLEVNNDDWIDKATAVSGCGPAYLMTTLLAYIQAAEKLGFNPEDSRLLVEQSYRGTLALIEHSQIDLPTLRQQLVTKAGVTERALSVFADKDLAGIWNEALATAYQRAKELSE